MDNDLKRLTRLTSILIQLLSRRLVNATMLADRFNVSVRTIYRDIKALEDAGVPIVTEEGKGYSVVAGYKIPPIMLTETEANALLTAELVIQASKDTSLITEFASVTAKIRSVLPNDLKTKTENLEKKLGVSNKYTNKSIKSSLLLQLQKTLTSYSVVSIDYVNKNGENTSRVLEPLALCKNQNDEWILAAFCRLRNDFRSFTLLNITNLNVLNETFTPHGITFEHYLDKAFGNKRS